MAHFETTQWAVVRAAASSRSTHARRALETLCSIYWQPIYQYIRHRGHSADEARDLTQEFFVHFLEKGFLDSVSPAKGRFRSFLMASVNHFLSNQHDLQRAAKRGGNVLFSAVDFAKLEEHYMCGSCRDASAEQLFDRAWALATIESALSRLRREYEKAGRTGLFEQLKDTLIGTGNHLPYNELGMAIGLSQGAVKTAVHRLRHRYRDVLLDEIAQTLTDGESVEEELRHLFSAVGT